MTELAPGVLFDEDAVISNCLEYVIYYTSHVVLHKLYHVS